MDGGAVLAYAVGGGDAYSFEFAAPPGEQLEPRNYVGVQRLPFRDPGHPGMEVTGNNHGCNTLGGRFELRDLVRDAAGGVQRLWVVFEQHCEGNQAAAWGEVRIGAPSPPAQERTAPGTVRWPPLDDWRRPTDVFVAYGGSAPVAAVAVDGAGFQADGSGCAGRAGPCDVALRFAPGAAGTHQAVLR